MTYKDKLNPWCIIRPVSNVQVRIVGRFRRRSDAEGHLQVLKRMIPNVPFEIMFDMATEYTEDLTPQQGSLVGKGEHESNSPLGNKAAPLPSPTRGGKRRGGEGLGERSTEE
ncbi:MAG TPA: hypothetical protein V6D43_15950 [Candidatus Sericytochromatia bacterium]